MNKKISYREYQALVLRERIKGKEFPGIKDLVLEYLGNKKVPVKREEIVHAMSDATSIEITDMEKVVSLVLRRFKNSGKVENTEQGYWEAV